MKRLLIFIVFLFSATATWAAGGSCPAAANYPSSVPFGNLATLSSIGITNCYYVSAGGSDSNTGADEAHPWAHLPGMTTCTGICATVAGSGSTALAGTGFILRGGDTWGSALLGISWNWGGTAGNPVYIGVDLGWFSGGSWSRPIMDCGGTTCGASGIYINKAYVILDDIEWKGLFQDASNFPAIYISFQASNEQIYRNYQHGWSHAAASIKQPGGINGNASGGGAGTSGSVVAYNVADGTDTTQDAFAFIGGTIPNAYGNYMKLINTGMDGGGDNWHDNVIDTMVLSSVPGSHSDGIFHKTNAYASNVFLYNNVVKNTTFAGSGGSVKFWMAGESYFNGTGYAFNNVVYNNLPGNVIDTGGHNAVPYGTWNIFNNTFECGTDSSPGACILGDNGNTGGTMTLTLSNNHWISTSNGGNGAQFSCTKTYVCSESNAVTQTIAQANANGYTSGSLYAFQPTVSTGATVNAGVVNNSLCNTLAAIDSYAGTACKAASTYGVTYNTSNHTVVVVARQPVIRGTVWDVGASEFSGGGSGGPSPAWTPNAHTYPNTLINTTSQTTFTLSNNGSSTPVLNISISVSGAGFSRAVGGTCGTVLGGGQSCTVLVNFTPTVAQLYSGTLTETDSINNVSATASLSGTGITPAVASFSPSPAAFGNQAQSTTSAALTVMLTNTGGSPLTLNTPYYTITGTNAADFALVAPGAPTWTLDQHVMTSCVTSGGGGGTKTCASTNLGVNITAGHSLILSSAIYNANGSNNLTKPVHNAPTGDSDTWLACPSALRNLVQFTNTSPSFKYWTGTDCYYVLSATGGTKTATDSWTFQSLAGSDTIIDTELQEFHANSGTVSVDASGTTSSASCAAACTGPSALTLTGTSDIVFPWTTTFSTVSSIAAPYTLLDTENTYVEAGFAYALNRATAPAPPWTMGGTATAVQSNIAFTAGTVANPCSNGQTLQPAQSCNIALTFTPSIVGAESATLNLSANITGTVNLTGTGTGTPQASAPTIVPGTGTYTATQTPTVNSSTGGVVDCVRQDGGIPTAATPGTCDAPATTVTNNTTITVTYVGGTVVTVTTIATKSGFINSGVTTATFTFQAQQNTALQPTSSLAGGKWIGPQTVNVSSGTSGSTILYTLDLSAPSDNGSCGATGTSVAVASGSNVSITTSETLKMYACESGFLNSPVATYNYQLYAAVPTFSPASAILGLQNPNVTVTVSNQTASSMCLTTDLSPPTGSGGTCTHGTLIASGSTQSITLTTSVPSETLFAISTDANLQSSNPGGGTYTLSFGTPWLGLLF